MSTEAKKPTIAVDFDGVIHQYSKQWHDGTIYDPPVPGTFESLAWLHNHGYQLVIFSVRAKQQKAAMQKWMLREMAAAGTKFPFTITAEKPAAKVYIDDRAVRFFDWSQALHDVQKYVDIPPLWRK